MTRTLGKREILTEQKYRESREKFGARFKSGMGAEAIRELLRDLNLRKLQEDLRREFKETTGQKRIKAIKRLEVVEAFINSGNKPEWMILSAVPVIAPELRPMVQLDGGRFATSDLNDLYRRVINRNNRLKRLLELSAPEIIIKNEKRMLQEAVDALIDNGRRGRPVTGPNNRPLKSLSDILKGKQGRFRQNLLGKRVDYSGRSVIVVGPNLKLHQCGLPKEMALELFKPFVMKKLVDRGQAHNIKSAKRMVERVRPEVWDVLDEVIREHPVLLNRAPTLHRLGIQAFEPVLVEGKAIHLHPLVCTPYNADFDGDQMAVHLPLSAGAQAEARILMLSANNILQPSFGNPVSIPTQDMVLGLYYLTFNADEYKGPARGAIADDQLYANAGRPQVGPELRRQRQGDQRARLRRTRKTRSWRTRTGSIGLQEWIWVRDRRRSASARPSAARSSTRPSRAEWNHEFVNHILDKNALKRLITDCYRKYGNAETAEFLDAIKALGFRYATQSGTTVSINDVVVPDAKYKLLDDAQAEVDELHGLFDQGFISQEEQYQKTIDIWQKTSDEVTTAMQAGAEPAQPGVHDGDVGCARFDRAGQAARRDARAHVRPVGPDPRDPGQGIAQRRAHRSRVLHLDARCAQGSRRYRAADGRLGLPDAPSRRRRARRHHPRGRLRDRRTGSPSATSRVGKETIEPLLDRIVGRRAAEDVKDPANPEDQDRHARRRDRRGQGQGDHRRRNRHGQDPLGARRARRSTACARCATAAISPPG